MKTARKILILSRLDDRKEYDTQQSMVRELSSIPDQQAVYSGGNFEDLLFRFDGDTLSITETNNGTDIADYDFVFFIGWFKTKPLEDIASAAARYLDHHNVPFHNTEVLGARSSSKISQAVTAAINDIAIAPFLFSMNQDLLVQTLRSEEFHRPFIAKRINASRGEDNYVFESPDELAHVLETTVSEKPLYFVVQEFIPNDGDYRILVFGDEVKMVIHRTAVEGSHLNNTSKGGSALLVDPKDLPPAMIEDSVRLAKLMRRQITGVDMIIHKETNKYYMLEINNMPQLSTGALVEQKTIMLDSFFEEATEK